jgi:co-chaperonin GroES (HSP10)
MIMIMEVIDEFSQLMENTANTIVENNLEDVYIGDVTVTPLNNYVLIQPYIRNPYRYIETTESGLIVGIESSQTYKSNETGETELNEQIIHCGKVLAKGPDCRNVEIGDDVFYTTYSMTPIPFRKKGYVIVGENLIICRMIKK